MYIRIQDNTIRYRISRKEAEQLATGNKLSCSISLSENFNLTYSLTVTQHQSSLVYLDQNNTINMEVNDQVLADEIKDRPTKSGIAIENHISENKKITSYLEIDLKKK